MRCLAALSVALFHFSSFPEIKELSAIWSWAQYGWAGVDAFFVISGFVVPMYFLKQEPSAIGAAKSFARRVVRIAGPLWVAALLLVSLNFASTLVPGYRGQAFTVDLSSMACTLSMSCEFAGVPWVSPIFWSVAIELQFCLAIAVVMSIRQLPFAKWMIAGTVLAGTAAAPMSDPSLLTHWAPLFLCGFLGWKLWTGRYTAHSGLAGLAGLAVTLALAWYTRGSVVTVLAALLVLFAAFAYRSPPRWMIWIGSISFSVYLLHVPIGGRVMTLSLRHAESTWALVGTVILATVASVIVAAIFHRWIEGPIHRFATQLFLPSTRSASVRAASPNGDT